MNNLAELNRCNKMDLSMQEKRKSALKDVKTTYI